MLVVSAFSRGGSVSSDVFDQESMLRSLERRSGADLPNLSCSYVPQPACRPDARLRNGGRAGLQFLPRRDEKAQQLAKTFWDGNRRTRETGLRTPGHRTGPR